MRAILIAVAVAGLGGLGACSWGSDSGTGNTGPDASLNSANQNAHCGDGVCAASEVDSCAADCGQPNTGSNTNTGSNNNGSNTNASACGDFVCDPTIGETVDSCPADCSGQGTGSDPTGGGSGALDCTDPTVEENCLLCVIAGSCAGVDPAGCAVCLGM